MHMDFNDMEEFAREQPIGAGDSADGIHIGHLSAAFYRGIMASA